MREAVDRFDRSGEAWVSAGVFDSGDRCLGRRLYGARKQSWAALEDKTIVDELWDAAGVARPESVVVAASDVMRWASRLDRGSGTVWAVDNSRGWHGGSEGTRWVGPDDLEAGMAWLEDRAERVRVMPFLEGVPCSIHGCVTRTGLAVFRPIELLVFRAPGRRFVYGGASAHWEASEALADQMREVAGRVGATLAEEHGYLGAFSVDGVATAEGFLPTELNPRMAVGLMLQVAAVDGLPLWSAVKAMTEGDLDLDPAWLEALVLDAGATSRHGRLGLVVFETLEPAEMPVAFDGTRARRVEQEEAAGKLSVGPSPVGSVVFFRFDADNAPWGERLALYAASAARLAADTWGFHLDDLVIAPTVGAPTGAQYESRRGP